MKPLRIAFGQPTGAPWRAGGVTTALLVVAASAVATTAYQGWQLRQRVADMQAAAGALGRTAGVRRADPSPRTGDVKLTADQLAAVNRAVAQLNLPWHGLLAGIERAGTPTVSLVSIEPDPQHELLRITAEAAGADAMVDYVAGLAQQTDFRDVAIRKHQVDLQNPYQPVRFVVELAWRQDRAGAPR